ncbi:MAG: ECF transporter S component, partial [Oscillospiraceae bacterium]|nr:ECF transporter S component [Oscillospiraceae bacterium]
MQTKDKTKAIVILGLMTAMVMLFSFTPIGTIPIPPLSITLNVIPIAVAAIALGPTGGLVIGAIFGL